MKAMFRWGCAGELQLLLEADEAAVTTASLTGRGEDVVENSHYV